MTTDLAQPRPRILDGEVRLDVGGLFDAFRGRSQTALPVATEPVGDAFSALQWARYHQCEILGRETAALLEDIRIKLSREAGQDTDDYRGLLAMSGADILALAAKQKRLASEEVDTLLLLMTSPVMQRWYQLAARLQRG